MQLEFWGCPKVPPPPLSQGVEVPPISLLQTGQPLCRENLPRQPSSKTLLGHRKWWPCKGRDRPACSHRKCPFTPNDLHSAQNHLCSLDRDGSDSVAPLFLDSGVAWATPALAQGGSQQPRVPCHTLSQVFCTLVIFSDFLGPELGWQ